MANETIIEAPVTREDRRGFLPLHTTTFDRYVISVLIFVALSLIWLRFIEAFLPIWIVPILSILIGIVIVRKG